MSSECDVTTLWRALFKDQEITAATLSKAKALLDELNRKAPCDYDFEELEEMRAMLDCD